jgi:hypothetical protein
VAGLDYKRAAEGTTGLESKNKRAVEDSRVRNGAKRDAEGKITGRRTGLRVDRLKEGYTKDEM